MMDEAGNVDWMSVGLGALFVAALAGVVLCFVALLISAQEWDKFKAEHHCTVVAHISGDVFNTFGVGSNGAVVVGVGSTPDKTGWRCDDGVTYYR